ncbi:MBL fold metallo-hydrolase [Paucibacter sp. PLA-PC-4]|uniref:MBL fold metallo-hydrolase n=1 Tax=Paucibacter sp. PLA-PC-4 TaxID=2993655 RepID=UPI002249A0C7|nr:MBL fold metallo-hydrolase [Paucibacter sp. PLA-PC-4]MCX2862861.1 MBL fold metallo-hydrolase [Paucibacter sp. PLA-PC-4]
MAPQLGNPRSLPPGLQVIERGWLSSNSVLLGGDERGAILIDSGYCTHAQQTASLLAAALAVDAPGSALRLIVNTHLHSDHCGGNAHLQALHQCPIWIPPGDFEAAKDWDEAKLSYGDTGQQCPRFTPTQPLAPGERLRQAGRDWEAHAAPGHDRHSIILFEPQSRLLISADALWERGFGIVFPEIDGLDAFDDVEATLHLIESLNPALVVPGHGAPFDDIPSALGEARSRLAFFRQRPDRHARHAAKALIMFHLLEASSQAPGLLLDWLMVTPIHRKLWQGYFKSQSLQGWSIELIDELLKSGVVRQHDGKLQPS